MSKNSSKNNQVFINETKNTIDNTMENYRETEKRINSVDDETKESEMELRNFRRENSIRNLKEQIKDVVDKENRFK
jgi:septal ring factor EnvC (AmiA/AmiB activator)